MIHDMHPILEKITVVIVNYRTCELTKRCVKSLLSHYPKLKIILVDNGSADDSTNYIRSLEASHPNIYSILNSENRYHGPGLDQGIQSTQTDLVFTLDTDCVILKSGFLENMAALFCDSKVYAVGKLVYLNRFGYEISTPKSACIEYIHPSHMMLDRQKYLKLTPFAHHGAPGIHNMRQVSRCGLELHDFPIETFIDHQGRGTCSVYGYNLGLKHKIEYQLNQAIRTLLNE